MFKLSVDPGYGFIKAINERGDKVRFPSIVGPGHDRSLRNALGGARLEKLEELHVMYKDTHGEEGEFFVGELARISKDATYSFEQNKMSDSYTRIQIATAAALLAPVNEPIWVGAGLPLEYFNTQRDEMRSMLSSLQATISIPPLNIKERKIRFSRVNVYAQGATSVYDGLLHPDGRPRHPEYLRPGNLIAAVNWGTRTVDIVVFKVIKNGFDLHTGLSFTLDDAGSMEIRRTIQTAFARETGFPCDLLVADQIFNDSGYIFYNKKDWDFTKDIDAAKRSLVKKVIKGLNGKWGTEASMIRVIFFSGGTVDDLGDALDLDGLSSEAHIIEDPQFSDARGTLHAMKMQERRERQQAINK